MKLVAVPLSLSEANRFIVAYHRHNGALPGTKFAIGAVDEDGAVHGVALAGIPKARLAMDGQTLEVSRVCTDGADNCCSFLYARCKQAAKAMGYSLLLTYTLPTESGASLKASGWTCVGEAGGGSWVRKNRPRTITEGVKKLRWEIRLDDPKPTLKWPVEADPETYQPSLLETSLNTTDVERSAG